MIVVRYSACSRLTCTGRLTILKETFVKHVPSMENAFANVLKSCMKEKNVGSYLCSQMLKLHKSGQCPNLPGFHSKHQYL